MRNNRIVRLVTLALMLALTVIMGFTPLGYLPPVFGVEITIMCLPVIISTVTMGLTGGLVVVLGFIFTSLMQMLQGGTGLLAPLLAYSPFRMVLCIIIPRLFIPIITYYVYKWTKKLPYGWRFGLSAAAGSLTNTVLFLFFVYVLGSAPLAEYMELTRVAVIGVLAYIAATNGVMELIAAVIICIPVLYALKAAMPQFFREPGKSATIQK